MTVSDFVTYVYGIAPAATEDMPRHGVGDPAGEVSLVPHGDLAALTSPIRSTHPLGRPEDLRAHFAVLNETVTQVPVLPLRFGSVMVDDHAVVNELLVPHHDDFLAALQGLKGKAQYLIKGSYIQEDLFREVLADNPQAADLCSRLSHLPPDSRTEQRIRLGELIHHSITDKRDDDTAALLKVVAPLSIDIAPREVSNEAEAYAVAVLIDSTAAGDVEHAVNALNAARGGRVHVRIAGPMAPFDFVDTVEA